VRDSSMATPGMSVGLRGRGQGGRAWAAELVRELGADQIVDVDRQRFEDAAGHVDLALDLVGGET
jgi:NADPH:quinone reductase-like Zn-dependent oxidoreductase